MDWKSPFFFLEKKMLAVDSGPFWINEIILWKDLKSNLLFVHVQVRPDWFENVDTFAYAGWIQILSYVTRQSEFRLRIHKKKEFS